MIDHTPLGPLVISMISETPLGALAFALVVFVSSSTLTSPAGEKKPLRCIISTPVALRSFTGE